jgi:GT2 family glycosyltransferase
MLDKFGSDSVRPAVAVVVLNWNNWKDTIECLESLLRIEYPRYRVLVVDNGSTDGSVEKIKAWADGTQEAEVDPTNPLYCLSHPPVPKPIDYVECSRIAPETVVLPGPDSCLGERSLVGKGDRIAIIQTGSNLGFAGGNNAGIQYALAQDDVAYIWLLNNDTVVDREALAEMVKTAESDRGVGITGSKLLYYDHPGTIQALGGAKINKWMGTVRHIGWLETDDGQREKNEGPDYIAGASMLVRREVVESVGPMDERYFLYCEDTDWCLRAREGGWRLMFCPRSTVWHKEGSTAGRKSKTTEYYSTRNTLILWKKFFPQYLPTAFILQLVGKLINRARRRQLTHVLWITQGYVDFLRGRHGKTEI